MRFDDSPNLFGVGCGVSTCAEMKCDFCGAVHNEGIGYDGDDNCDGGEFVAYTTFAGLNVCDCCFEHIEDEMLRRMSDVLKWYARIVNKRQERFEKDKAMLGYIANGGYKGG